MFCENETIKLRKGTNMLMEEKGEIILKSNKVLKDIIIFLRLTAL